MINHVRTLLRNKTGDPQQDLTTPWREFVPVSYTAVELPPYLSRLHAVLFGAVPDEYMLAYRLQQLMATLHTSDMADFAYWFDKRVTYLPIKERLFYQQFGVREGAGASRTAAGSFGGSFGHVFTLLQLAPPYDLLESSLSVITVFTSDPGANCYIYGDFPEEKDGRIYYSWRLKVDGPSINVRRSNPTPYETEDVPYSYIGNVSSPIRLIGSGLKAELTNITIGDHFVVTYMAKPRYDIGEILVELESRRSEDTYRLFGEETTEPIATFRHVWNTHPFAIMRLASLVLALAYRIDAVRKKEAVG